MVLTQFLRPLLLTAVVVVGQQGRLAVPVTLAVQVVGVTAGLRLSRAALALLVKVLRVVTG